MQPEFVHEFVRGDSKRTLLLLHGTGGNERDLIPLGRELDPKASLLSPREAALLAVALPNPFEREAGSPGAGTRRLADNLLLRMRAARGNAACVRAGPFGG